MPYLILLLSLFVTAPTWATDNYNIQLVNKTEETLRFQKIIVLPSKSGAQLSGRITASRPQTLPKGHVDITAVSKDGEQISKFATPLEQITLSRRQKEKGGVRFSTIIPSNIPPGSTLKISFHRNDNRPNKAPHLCLLAL